MKNTFTLSDINRLMISFGNATIGHDCLAEFLNSFDWDHIFETEDGSLIFMVDCENEIEIEFTRFNNPLTRKVSILYTESGEYKMMEYDELIKSALSA